MNIPNKLMSQGLFLNAIISNAANRFILLFIGVLLALCLTGGNALGQSNLEYQKRASRYEGTKPKPVSGLGIELLSAHIAYQDDTSTLGERYQVRFFLNEILPVHLLVRELNYKHFYWLDKVEPETPWRAGFSNVYSWPTADVIRHLNRLSLYDLGIVVRLNKSEPSADEWVAPALLYQSGYPATTSGYTFVFRMREDAKIKGAIYRESGGNPIFTQDLGLKRGNRPFWFQWSLAHAAIPEGKYKLVLNGYVVSNNNPVTQVVRFYHQPRIQ
jgi:hypothetical protein